MVTRKKLCIIVTLLSISLVVLLLIFVISGFLFRLKPEKNLEVLNATCGPIRGNIYRHANRVVDGYLGIPFAKAPVGILRYEKPVAIDGWTEPKDCYEYGPACPQSGPFSILASNDRYKYREDNCLNLNVFTPRTNSTEFPDGLPVMVYFYGGGFEIGSSADSYDYSLSGILPLKDVIVVTVNYRVGPLGFFTTGDDVAHGNNGLWDQRLSLQWVQKHILSFGGDPNSVTIFGTSAGGASADLLALSPHSNGLFHRFIASSGTAFCDFSMRPKSEQSRIFRDFAKFHGFSGNDSKSLLEWYRAQPASKFREVEGFEDNASGFLSFVPNLDGDFFPKPLDELRRTAPKIDGMVINGEYEGLGFANVGDKFENITEHFVKAIQKAFGPDLVAKTPTVQQKLLDYYLNDSDTTDKTTIAKKLAEFVGDSWFNIGAFDTVRSCAKYGNNVYLASFNYYNREYANYNSESYLPKGASHGADLKYTFGDSTMFPFDSEKEEFKVVNLIGTFVTNFAKYGNPNGNPHSNFNLGPEIGKWERYTLDDPLKYFKIDYPKSEMSDNYQNGRLEIYDDINRKYGKKYQEIVYGNQDQ